MDAVFRWLGWSPAALPRARRRFQRAQELAVFGVAGLLLLAWAVLLVEDWIAWQIGDAGRASNSEFFLIILIGAIGQSLVLLYRTSRDGDVAIALRALVRRAPAELVKPVTLQPRAPSALSTPSLGTRAGPFSWPGRGDWPLVGLFGWEGLIVGLFGIAVGGAQAIGVVQVPRIPIVLVFAAVAIAFSLLDVLAGLSLIVASSRLRRRGLWLEATALELRGRRFDVWPRPVAVPWGRARTFYGFKHTSDFSTTSDISVYILEGDDAVITWAITSKTSAAAREASDALCRLIVANTGLALLDATDTLGWLGRINDAQMAKWAQQYGTPNPPRRIRRFVLPLALLFLITIAGFAADNVIPSLELAYYNPLVQRIHAQTPLYHSALAQPDGAWSPPAAGDGVAMVSGGAYQLTATNANSVISLLGTNYGDMAVQVTVDGWPNGTPADVGLVVRDDPTQHQQIVLMLFGDYGCWQLVRLPDTSISDTGVYLAHGCADSLPTGTTATNQLLVVVRGTQYLCYINGRFIGAGYDNTLTHGQPGLYVERDAGSVSFSNFAVYPTVP